MKILVSSCEYGDFTYKGHSDVNYDLGNAEVRMITHTDESSVLSRNSMHPRLYGKINRMMDWSLYPGYDYYIWTDSRIEFHSPKHVLDFVASMSGDIGFFRHRFVSSIQEEADFITERKDLQYISSRYNIPLINAQVKHYKNAGFDSHKQPAHFETGLFCYSKSLVDDKDCNLMTSWLMNTMMWSANDQISLPFSVWSLGIKPHIYEGNVLQNRWTSNNYSGYK